VPAADRKYIACACAAPAAKIRRPCACGANAKQSSLAFVCVANQAILAFCANLQKSCPRRKFAIGVRRHAEKHFVSRKIYVCLRRQPINLTYCANPTRYRLPRSFANKLTCCANTRHSCLRRANHPTISPRQKPCGAKHENPRLCMQRHYSTQFARHAARTQQTPSLRRQGAKVSPRHQPDNISTA
jgi:hypothetical protein